MKRRNLHFSIKGKLFLCFGILIVALSLLLVVISVTTIKSKKINNSITELYTPSLELLHELEAELTNSKMLIKNWVFIEKKDETPDKLRLINLHQEILPNLFSAGKEYASGWTPGERNSFHSLQKLVTDSLVAQQQVIMDKLNSLGSYNDPLVMFEVVPMVEESGPIMTYSETALNIVNDLINKMEVKAENARAVMAASLNDFQKIIIITTLAVIVLMIFVTLWIVNSIVTPLKKGVDFARKIEEGDLKADVEINQKDEVGKLAHALKNMAGKLSEIISTIRDTADEIATFSEKVDTNTVKMVESIETQTSSTEQVSSSIQEMTANIAKNTENSQQTEKISRVTSDGIQDVKTASVEAMSSMNEISEKISIVTEIAFQTNILALNAAVEAARAGEHGKGFAVVAAEVRKLAERSKVAAEQITSLTGKSSLASKNSGEKLEAIVPEIEKTAVLVQEITHASIEQNTGVEQINKAILDLNNISQQTRSEVTQMMEDFKILNNHAFQLKNIVSYFKI